MILDKMRELYISRESRSSIHFTSLQFNVFQKQWMSRRKVYLNHKPIFHFKAMMTHTSINIYNTTNWKNVTNHYKLMFQRKICKLAFKWFTTWNFCELSIYFCRIYAKRVTQRIGFKQVLNWPTIHLTPSGNKKMKNTNFYIKHTLF